MITEPKKETITNSITIESTQVAKPVAKYTQQEAERVNKWENRKQPSFEFELEKGENELKHITHIGFKFSNPDLSDNQKNKLFMATLSEAMGTTSAKLAHLLKRDVLNGFNNNRDTYDAGYVASAILEAMLELKPADSIEAMIISQMLVLQNQSMYYMSLAIQAEHAKNQDRHINNATKLMRLFNEKLESLNRYRRKGEQRVVVQHVNVNEGGQAIVGNVVGGGDISKK